jgi:flagellar assembly protein FliH
LSDTPHVPKEQQTAYQRWEMTSFGDERPSVVAARRQAEAEARAARAEAADASAAALEEAEDVPAPPQFPTVAELEAMREEARQAGHAEGVEAGRKEGFEAAHAEAKAEARAAFDAELEHLRAIAAEFSTALSAADELIADEVLDLALHLARDMLRTALPARPELVVPMVREAIEYLPVLQQPALLMLHPDDAQAVRDGIGEELDKGGWRVVDDPSVGRGGCKIDTASNQIDAQASTRWARLTQALGKDLEWLQP